MKFKFKAIEEAFFHVDFGQAFEGVAILCKDTGEIFYDSNNEWEEESIPDEVWQRKDCIGIPDKRDLDLGTVLVFEFVNEYMPEMYGRVKRIFSHSGAYANFKDLLEDKELLETWYEFEDKKEEKAIREWCAENGVELED